MLNLSLLKINWKGALRQLFIFLRSPTYPLPSLNFVFGWSNIFVDSESGPLQSVKVLQYVNGLQPNPASPFPTTHSIHSILCTYNHRGKSVELEKMPLNMS
jgi:hypothetical protein